MTNGITHVGSDEVLDTLEVIVNNRAGIIANHKDILKLSKMYSKNNGRYATIAILTAILFYIQHKQIENLQTELNRVK